jgi:hypothetical protein
MEKILSVMGNNPFFLLKHMSMKGVSDYILYDQVKTYTINPSLLIPNNIELDSTIHTDHTNDHLKLSFNILKKYENKIKNVSFQITNRKQKYADFVVDNVYFLAKEELDNYLMKKELNVFLSMLK